MDLGSLIGGGGLVTAILTIGGTIKWWVGRQDAKKDPIPKDAAAVALSASAVQVSQAVLNEVRAEMSLMRGELAAERSNRTALEGRVESVESMFGAAMAYINTLLRHIRDGRMLPAPPVPRDLRDLVDPALHD